MYCGDVGMFKGSRTSCRGEGTCRADGNGEGTGTGGVDGNGSGRVGVGVEDIAMGWW